MQLAAETHSLAVHQILTWRTPSQLKSNAAPPAEDEMGMKVVGLFTEISAKERRMHHTGWPSEGQSIKAGELSSYKSHLKTPCPL